MDAASLSPDIAHAEPAFETYAQSASDLPVYDPRRQRTFTSSCLGDGVTPITGNFYFDPSSFDCLSVADGGTIPLFTFGNSGRNIIRGPGINNVDLSVFKHFKFGEQRELEFRSEFFNAFNHTQFVISGNSSTAFGFTDKFGQVTQARDPRIIQFALKLSF